MPHFFLQQRLLLLNFYAIHRNWMLHRFFANEIQSTRTKTQFDGLCKSHAIGQIFNACGILHFPLKIPLSHLRQPFKRQLFNKTALCFAKLKLENGVYYCFRQSVDVFRTVVVQPLHRHVEQHSRIQIGHVGRFFGVIFAKRRNKIFVEVVKIQILKPCLSQQFEGLLVL